MKKALVLAMVLVLAAGFVFANAASEKAAPAPEVKAMTHDELVAAAQAEGTLTIYSYSSRTAKVAEAFSNLYGIKVETTQLKDSEMIEKVSTEAAAGLDAADLILCQDGSRVYPELILAGYTVNYLPEEYKGLIAEKYQDPLVYEFCNKLFMYNNENGVTSVKNVWELTEPQWKNKFQTKDAFQEGVNLNFFTMCTREDWAQKLADAYKALYGKDIVLDADCPNAGYQLIKGLYANAVLGKSDTTINEQVGAAGVGDYYGLYTYNKTRNSAAKNLHVAPNTEMVPFAGFMYPVYCFITSNARSTNAAKLFVEYAFTSEGFEPYKVLGDYSAKADLVNPEDPISFSQWESILVVEDPEWCAEARPDVEEFISRIM
ncbi:MAG: ABC transporter substrate-binding protein [Spirochaetales bacterium]|nr:ABC transporter substrate-binding protein [Candidatus Physcosoma equi]